MKVVITGTTCYALAGFDPGKCINPQQVQSVLEDPYGCKGTPRACT